MNVVAQFRNVDSVQVSLTVTMALRDWKSLRDSMTVEKYPEFKLREAINDVVSKLERRVEPDIPPEEVVGVTK